jgi:hypothetical protein
MKALLGQSILILVLSSACFAFLSITTDLFDLRHSIEHFSLRLQTTGPPTEPISISGQPSDQKASEKRPPGPASTSQTKAPEPSEQKPAEEKPTAIQEVSQPASPSTPRPIVERGYDQLAVLGRETAGYGLYSYGVLTAPSPRSAAFLGEIFRSIPPTGDSAAVKAQVNIFYIPTRKDKVADLVGLVTASRDGQLKLAGRYSEAIYDYKMARAILNHLCNPPPNPMKGQAKAKCREAHIF